MAGSSSKKTLYGILAVACGTLVLVVVACGKPIYWRSDLFAELPKAQASASNFLDHLDAGRIHFAYQATAPAFKAKLTREEFSGFVQHYPALQKQTSRTMSGMRFYKRPSGEQVIMDYQLANDQNSLSLMLSLAKVNGQWLVEGVSLP